MRRSFVAMFHEIHDTNWFENTLLHLSKSFEFVDADQILHSLQERQFRKAQCHVSFDDGHRSFLENALPVLIKHNIPASLFVSPKVIINSDLFWFQKLRQIPKVEFKENIVSKLKDRYPESLLRDSSNIAILKTLKYAEISTLINEFSFHNSKTLDKNFNINTDQLQEIVSSGLVEIGAHTMNHPILANETDDTAKSEIVQSIAMTQDLIKKPVRLFACPNGLPGLDFGAREESIMKENGIVLNFSTKADSLTDKYGFYCMPRIGITKGSYKFIDLKLKIAPLWVFIRNDRNPNSEMNQRKRLIKTRVPSKEIS